ncbi:serine/threonine-protein kinase pakA [Drosophila bipectinata]|uniref:serine/threonine-protein kinase pakA n=1 Tax=Drosophila bipectinata TaxID=42026 RepID=UPI001C896CBF|nr:serine/threonine-protein kinase pakA [Drosophila bipectinata]
MNRILCASRRHVSDVFHGDPFKIQSYNFRYADKPVYHVQHYQRPPPSAPPPARKPSFETFYLNPKFNRDSEYTSVNRPPPTSSFSEHRRRRFLQDFKAVPSHTMRSPLIPMPERQRSVPVAPQPRRPPVSPTVTDSPLLRTCCSRGEYQTMRRGQSTSSLRTCTSNGGASLAGNARSASVTTFACGSNGQLQTKRSACSGCAININICGVGVDPESEVDNNVSIKIETDACLLNNKDLVRSGSSSGKNRSGSSGSRAAGTSFGIDKRLSKFNVSETKPRTSPDWERRQRQREVELKREQVLFRERQHQEELKKERERELQQEREFMRRREQEREHLRQLERQREREHLLALETERERQRLRELERETQRQREYNRLVEFQEQLCHQPPTRAAGVPPPSPVPMTSHLYTPASDDRLPGMMPFCDVPSRRDTRTATPVRHQAVAIPLPPPPVSTSTPLRSSSRSSVGRTAVISSRSDTPVRNSNRTPTPIRSVPPSRSSTPIPNSTTRNPVHSRNPTPTRNHPQIGSSSRQPTPTRNAPRNVTPLRSSNRSLTPLRTGTSDRSSSRNSRSSGTSNGNVHVSVAATRIVSNSRLSESKQINGGPAIVTRLNNVPIRITTTRPGDRDLEFSMNQVTVREPVTAMPAPRTVFRRRSDSSQSGHDACQVNINVYADNLRRMRI